MKKIECLSKTIVTTDLHLTNKPQDEYRWQLFDWLEEIGRKYKCIQLIILGDLTDAHDHHGAELVNRITRQFEALRSCFDNVVILKGNHDYSKPEHPFFEFLNVLDGVDFISSPDTLEQCILFLPHTKNPAKDWRSFDFTKFDLILMHQTWSGSLMSNGTKIETGLKVEDLPRSLTILSGDVHVPQQIGPVTYIGSPYPVHFGDRFQGRVMVIDKDGFVSYESMPCLQRCMVTINEVNELLDMELNEGDQIKVRLSLREEDLPYFRSIRDSVLSICKDLKVEVYGIELDQRQPRQQLLEYKNQAISRIPSDSLKRYAKRQDVAKDVLQVGLDIVEKK